MTYFPFTKLKNILGNLINPATEDKQDDIITLLQDAATEDTLSSIDTSSSNIDTNLSSVILTDSHLGENFLKINNKVHICGGNSSTTPLGAGLEFTGTWHDVNGYAEILVTVRSDKNSATDGLIIEHSIDGIEVDDTDKFSILGGGAGSGTSYRIVPGARYIRVRYINGATPQTLFRLSTTFRGVMTAGSTHRVDETLKDNSDAPLGISVLKLRKSNNDYVSGTATNSGNFKVSIEEIESNVTFNTKSYLIDENGQESQMLSDNYFNGSPVIIDTEHHEIHCGDAISATHVVDLGNGGVLDILIITPVPTPSTKRYHFYIDVISESEADLKLYETPTTTANGSALAARNRNRQDPVVSENEVLFYTGPTVTSAGTLLEWDHWGSGKLTGGEGRGKNEWVFKNNNKYLIRITNSTATNNQIGVKINYYVHPGV